MPETGPQQRRQIKLGIMLFVLAQPAKGFIGRAIILLLHKSDGGVIFGVKGVVGQCVIVG